MNVTNQFLRLPLMALAAAHAVSRELWHAKYRGRDLECEGESYEAFRITGEAIIALPCQSIDAVRDKVNLILSDDALLETLTLGDDESAVIPLLRSFLGEGALA